MCPLLAKEKASLSSCDRVCGEITWMNELMTEWMNHRSSNKCDERQSSVMKETYCIVWLQLCCQSFPVSNIVVGPVVSPTSGVNNVPFTWRIQCNGFCNRKTKCFLQNVVSHNNVYWICLAESMWFCLSDLSDLFSTKPVCTTDTWNLSVERLYPSLPNWFKESEVYYVEYITWGFICPISEFF